MKISVTVPVYNTSRYLHKCLDSLSAQTLTDIEFILVDDGSTDNSGEICDEYAIHDSRFKVIHQKNGGLAVARQTGLDAAKGDYVIVCDSDDWVEPNMYELLYNSAVKTNADIVCCGYFAEYNDGRSIPKQLLFNENNSVIDNYDFLLYGVRESWAKLVRRSLFQKAGASYAVGINLGEDALIFYKLLKANPMIAQINAKLYHYRKSFGGDSYTNNVRMSHVYQLEFIYKWLNIHYPEDNFEQLRFNKAIDLAFACLRASDIDVRFLKEFIHKELSINRFSRNNLSIKSLFIFSQRFLSFNVLRIIVKKMYGLIYSHR